MTIRDAMSGTQTEEVEPPEHALITETVEEVTGQPEHDEASPSQQSAWIALLQADTPKDQVHQRAAMNRMGQPVLVNNTPLMLDYVTARFVQDRLDAAVGPANWQTIFESLPSGAVRCGIGIRPPGEGEWITKWDVGVPSNIEPDKGAHSDAFKRAAVQWGIARDLYDDRDEKAMQAQPSPMAVQAQPQPGNGAQQQPPPGIAYASEPVMPVGAQPHPGTAQAQGAWLCPLHGDAKIVPAGISKRTGRNYSAFYACPVSGCDQKGPSA